jgi:homoserine dehydrogenase
LTMRTVPVILFGVGGVGRSLVHQILSLRGLHALEYGLHFDIVAICDSNGAFVSLERELEDELLLEAIELKGRGGKLATHPLGGPQGDSYSIVDIAGRSNAIVVDCSSSESTLSGLLYALERGYKVVLANKKPLTADQDAYDYIVTAGRAEGGEPAARNLARARWEATVGAGLPVNATLSRLVASGDDVQRLTGTLSGTLGYVMSGLHGGRAFSEVVSDAVQHGYTEPDPRDDLNGLDVARKALILARGLGWRLDLADVAVEPLYPASMDDLSVEQFLIALPQLDEEFRRKVADAEATDSVLRYAARVEDGRCSAGPVSVPKESPIGRLTGTDNLVEFVTRWYNPNPLVIQGPGAGVDVTAAGVLADMIELTFTS